ncbi:hypothetical protein Sgleb_12600 [Streptomyces glebosus]|uniref:Immunity protein 35 domain-containing protein n=1 Tax=Streptomyces glebosus TaxID=249580 RepID=A0A640SNZ7_9ACTN|nr:hypothetical protein [Streptomyces glebosus]GFE13213.1 hypothetical protein Sgleb_12600 [Streptomyces glebosus]GHG66949.1 hypothetical protein GCM10010513_36710 [Streptomyces glebosus]
MTSDNNSPTDPQAAPTNAEEALESVRRQFGQPRSFDGTPAPLHVKEFDLGYLVYATFARPVDQNGRPVPAPPGGSSFVVAKDTGKISTVPNYPPDQAIALYRKQRAKANASEE